MKQRHLDVGFSAREGGRRDEVPQLGFVPGFMKQNVI